MVEDGSDGVTVHRRRRGEAWDRGSPERGRVVLR
jgi:hypothetical protein